MKPPEGFDRARVVTGPVSIEIDRDGDAVISSESAFVLANRRRTTVLVMLGSKGPAIGLEIPVLAIGELIVALSAAQSYLAMVDDPRDAA